MKHPKYEHIINKFYKIINNEEKILKLTEKSDLLELKEMEFLIGIDICSFRIPNCRSVLGDRDWTITQKRMKAKLRLSDLLQVDEEQYSKEKSTEMNDIKKILTATEEDEEEDNFDFAKVKQSSITKEKKSDDQIYQEVFIDEINAEMIKNINKCEGTIINVLLKEERLSSFEKLWENTFEDHYKDLDRKRKLEEIKEKRLKKKEEDVV